MDEGEIFRTMSAEDRRTFDRWLKANAILALIYAVGIIAMAVASFNSGGPGDAAAVENAKTSDVVASERHGPRARVRHD
jgi:hypothetical protein